MIVDYELMTDEQRSESVVAQSDILEVAQEHRPMIVFEAMCTLLALLSFRLGFPVEEILSRIQTRYEILERDSLANTDSMN